MNPRFGRHYSVAVLTGTMAAALGADSTIFAMYMNPAATSKAYVERIRLQWTALAAFTTPITVGRRLAVFRGSGSPAAAGTAIAAAAKKSSIVPASEFASASGGDMRISATAALTVAGITFETDPLLVQTLTHVGAAGANLDVSHDFDPSDMEELIFQPGELLAIKNPIAMDAGGTWQLGVTVRWREVPNI